MGNNIHTKYKCIETIPGVVNEGTIVEVLGYNGVMVVLKGKGSITKAQLQQNFKYVTDINANINKTDPNKSINS